MCFAICQLSVFGNVNIFEAIAISMLGNAMTASAIGHCPPRTEPNSFRFGFAKYRRSLCRR